MDTDTTIATTAMSSEALRAQMVEKIRKAGHAHRAGVERVLRDTPHHEFVPDADVAVVYDPWRAVVTHRFDDGRASSCASAPWVVAAMLDQLKARRFVNSRTRPQRNPRGRSDNLAIRCVSSSVREPVRGLTGRAHSPGQGL